MLVNVIPGKSYAVTAQADCTVTCEHQGRTYTLCSAASGAQAYFVSPIDTVTVSDDTALVTETFNSAALAVLGGGGTSEPEGDYLTFDGKGVVTGGRLDNVIDISGLQYKRRGLTSWSIPLPSVQIATDAFVYTKIQQWKTSLPECVSLGSFLPTSALEVWEADIPKAKEASSIFNRCHYLHTVKGNFESVENGYEFCYLCPNLKVIDATFPKLSDGRGFATSAKLDKASALRILNSIPAYSSGSHQLAIGIHIDHKTDEDVLAAIAAAEAKGWTLSLGWNGTPTTNTASTYGLRTPSVYARVIEGEYGKHFDWGHYVTDPTGYEEFRSVEAAREYFGIEE